MPASAHDRHGGVALSCKHLLLMRRHLGILVRTNVFYYKCECHNDPCAGLKDTTEVVPRRQPANPAIGHARTFGKQLGLFF